MPGSDLGRELGDGVVEHSEVVRHGVGAGVTRPQASREGLAGGVREAQHR
jgi:hypothetical protein